MSLRMSCHVAVSPIKRERSLPAAVCEHKDLLFAKNCGNINQDQKKLSKCTVLCKTLGLGWSWDLCVKRKRISWFVLCQRSLHSS